MVRPKFKEQERVEVVKGFYRGNTGTILRYNYYWGFIFIYFTYTVMFDKNGDHNTIDQRDLRSLDSHNEKFNKKLENLIK